jgi:hypothetical protein
MRQRSLASFGRIGYTRSTSGFNKKGGDSGSLLVDAKDQTALGLLFASAQGVNGNGLAGVAGRMETVLATFAGKILVRQGEGWP